MKNSINLIKQERKLPFSPDWGLLGPALRYTFFLFFCFVEVSALLDVRYHPNEQFDPILGNQHIFFEFCLNIWVLSLLVVRHCSKLSSCATWENDKNPNFNPRFWLVWQFGPQNIFSWDSPLPDVRYRHKLSSYSILMRIYDPN